MNRRLVVCALAVCSAACGPSFSFRPSNLPATFDFAATDAMLFGSGGCGPRAELDTDTGEVRCFDSGGGVFNVPFHAAVTKDIVQSDTTPLMVFVGRSITINTGTEVQLRGNRPAILVSLGDMTIAGRITAQDSIAKYAGQGGGFSDPTSEPAQGNGPGGGHAVTGAGAGGASYCGVGGKGGDDTGSTTGAAGGATYGTQNLIPLRGGSSGGKQGNHSGAGGGALQLVASGQVNITADALINMGGLGGGWFGNGGGSGGAVLIEGDTVTVAGKITANGGGGGGGAPAGGTDGDNASPDTTAALGGAAGAGGSAGGVGSAGATIDGAAAGSTSGQPGGGGGGAGRIRINGRTAPAVTGLLSPATSTVCTSTGTVTPNP